MTDTTNAFRVHEAGGPEVLSWENVPLEAPGPGQVRLRHTAVGVNYIDTYHRSGLYGLPLPTGIGLEAAGVVETVGEGVTDFAVGDRAAYPSGPIGAYAEAVNVPAARILKLPEDIDDRHAAAMMMQGMTSQYLLRQTYEIQPGDTVLIHAAAGGVGLIACQWAKHLGAEVIGTVGSEEKAALARAHGCDHAILYRTENIAERVRDITDGKGVPVVYDSVGKDTWDKSIDCLSPRGLLVIFGNSSGLTPPIDSQLLMAKGSLYFTRPSLAAYTASTEDLRACATDLFAVVQSGAVKIEINQEYPLKEAVQAHIDLEGRKTTGSIVLIP